MGNRAAAWRVAFAFLVTMLGTTLPTPLYPLYQSRFRLTALAVTGLYALYAVGVIMALLLFGAWSDRIGRRRMVRAGLLLSGLSAVAFVAAVRLPAGGLAALLAGRILSGLSVGFVTGAATAALVDLAGPGRKRRASLVSAAVNTGGLAAGPLLAGVLAQYWREPLQSAFAVDLALVAIAVLGLIRIPEPAAVGGGRRRLQRLGVPAPVRGAFFRVGLAGFASFAVLGLFAAVSAAFLTQVMHERNYALVGGVACLAFLTSTLGQLLSAAVPERRALLIGCLGLAAGAGLVAESLIRASLPLLVAAATVSGLSHGLVFRAGLTVVTAASPAARRAEVASSFFVTLYIGISIPVVGLGAGADRYGLLLAGKAFAALAGLLALLAFLTVLPRRGLLPRGDVAAAPVAIAGYPATDTGAAAVAAANAATAAATFAAEASAAAATAAAAATSAAAFAANAASAALAAATAHAAATAIPAAPSRAPVVAAPSVVEALPAGPAPGPMSSTDGSAGGEPAEAAPGAGGPAPNPDGPASSLGTVEVDPEVSVHIGAADRPWRLIAAAAVTLLVLAGGGVAYGAVRRSHPETTAGLSPVLSSPSRSPSPLSSPSASPAATPPVLVSADRPVVRASINVGTEPEGVAVAPDSRTVYVANQHSHVLSVIDVASRNVSSVGLTHTPRFVAVSGDGTQVFASMYEDDLSGSGVAIVDAATKSVRYLHTGPQPYALSVAPDGKLWVPIHSQHRIEVYDPNTGTRVATVDIPPNAHSVTFSPTLERAFTPDHESNLVSAIDMHTNRPTNVPVDNAPHSLALSPDQRTIIVACYGANVVDFIDPVSLRNTGRLPVGVKPRYVAFSVDGSHAYVVNEGSDSVSVIDVATRTVSSVVPVGHSPRTLGVAPDGRFAYASNGRDNTVSVLDLAR